MTNAEIILSEQVLHNISEDLHTFAKWKALGYTVKKGEKAAVQTKLWKMTKKKAKADDDKQDGEDVEEQQNHYYLAKAFLFKRSQVEVTK